MPKLALSHYDGRVLRKYGAYKKGDAGYKVSRNDSFVNLAELPA